MANKYRGTIEVQLGGEEYTLRPTFEALVEFEEKTGMTVGQAYIALMENGVSVKIVSSAIWAGIKGEAIYQNDKKLEKSYGWVGQKVVNNGVGNSLRIALDFIMYAMVPVDVLEKIGDEGDDEKKQIEADQ